MKKKQNDDMRSEYDFKGGERGKFYRPEATLTVVRLQPDIVEYYLSRAKREKRGYNELINDDLRQMMQGLRHEDLSTLIRSIVVEEIKKHRTTDGQKRRKAA